MISVTLNIEVECSRCGSAMETKFDGETLSVESCTACMDEQWDRGYAECEKDQEDTATRQRITSEIPIFDHDCESCIFLGGGNIDGQHGVWYDYYYCPQGGRSTVIARYSSDGPCYLSGFDHIEDNPPLMEAYRRAKEAGLIK